MSSMHTHITIDKDKGELRGDLMFRDCHECITFSYWITRRRRHKTKAIKALYKIRAEIDRFIEAYEKGAEELSHNGTLKR